MTPLISILEPYDNKTNWPAALLGTLLAGTDIISFRNLIKFPYLQNIHVYILMLTLTHHEDNSSH